MSVLLVGMGCLTLGLVLGYVLRETWAWAEVRRSRRRAKVWRSTLGR